MSRGDGIIRRVDIVECAGCGQLEISTCRSRDSFRIWLRDCGWQTIDGRDDGQWKCPDCRQVGSVECAS